MLSVFNQLEKELVAVYLRDFPLTQRRMQRVCLIIRTFEEDFRRATGAITHALHAEVAGGLMMGLGLVLAPVHQGISALIAGAGAAVVSAAVIGEKTCNKKITILQTNLIQDTEAELRAFQHKISPMMDKMNEISQHVSEILRDLSYPGRDVGYLSQYFSSASEVVRFIQIYDISVLAAQIKSQTSCLLGAQFIRVLPERMVLQQMWIEMVQLENVMDAMTKTIERIANQPN